MSDTIGRTAVTVDVASIFAHFHISTHRQFDDQIIMTAHYLTVNDTSTTKAKQSPVTNKQHSQSNINDIKRNCFNLSNLTTILI